MNKITLIVFGAIIVFTAVATIIEEGIFCPILLVNILFAVIWIYLLKIELYMATYIFVDIANRKVYIKTKHKGEFEYSFSQIYVVTRKNYGARFEFDDGKKIEFNRYVVEIETTEKLRMQRNIEKDDLPGVYIDERL